MIIPSYYKKLKSMPDDPPMSEVFLAIADSFQCFLKIYPIPEKYLMPLNTSEIIDGIHQNLDETQGLIECDIRKTNTGGNAVYSIIKNKMHPSGVQYFLRMHVMNERGNFEIDLFADEKGLTGWRDTSVYELLMRKNKGIRVDGWNKDPYDSNYKKGFLMNLSEDKRFDELFKNHPLSEIRRMVEFFINNN